MIIGTCVNIDITVSVIMSVCFITITSISAIITVFSASASIGAIIGVVTVLIEAIFIVTYFVLFVESVD